MQSHCKHIPWLGELCMGVLRASHPPQIPVLQCRSKSEMSPSGQGSNMTSLPLQSHTSPSEFGKHWPRALQSHNKLQLNLGLGDAVTLPPESPRPLVPAPPAPIPFQSQTSTGKVQLAPEAPVPSHSTLNTPLEHYFSKSAPRSLWALFDPFRGCMNTS